MYYFFTILQCFCVFEDNLLCIQKASRNVLFTLTSKESQMKGKTDIEVWISENFDCTKLSNLVQLINKQCAPSFLVQMKLIILKSKIKNKNEY